MLTIINSKTKRDRPDVWTFVHRGFSTPLPRLVGPSFFWRDNSNGNMYIY